jgi:Glycosyl hydrolase catalytic core
MIMSKRGLAALLSAVAIFPSAMLSESSYAQPRSSKAAVATVPASFFGMDFSSATYQPWPGVQFSTLRTWDQYPGVSWADLNPSSGVYNWANLDAVVNAATAHGVDIVYTFGYVPPWASSNPTGSCAGGPVGTCYAPNPVAWQDFVTQVTARYKGKIKYWELWNEPNAGNFWQGTPSDLVTMASAAYNIIKNAGGTLLSPAPQGNNAHLWLSSYFAAGGGPYTDSVSFHGYVGGAPELITTLAANVKGVMAQYGLSGKQLWDTEHSWGDSSWPFGATPDQQAAWLARFVSLSLSSKIDRSIWYKYDSYEGQAQWGSLFDATSKQMSKPGLAYQQVYKWIVGAKMDSCVLSGAVYQCHLTRTTPYEALIVWNVDTMDSQTATFTPPTAYTQYQTLDGTTTSFGAGAQVPIGMKPILLERLK